MTESDYYMISEEIENASDNFQLAPIWV